MTEKHQLPPNKPEAAELDKKDLIKRVVNLHKSGKSKHEIAAKTGLSEGKVIRIIAYYNRQQSEKEKRSLINAFGLHGERNGVEAFKEAITNIGFKKG